MAPHKEIIKLYYQILQKTIATRKIKHPLDALQYMKSLPKVLFFMEKSYLQACIL
jgi:hypothetical protein